MSLIYVDAFAGAAGDMILGALVDAGADLEAVRRHLATLPVDGFALEVREEVRRGLRCTRLEVRLDEGAGHHHRGLADVEAILDAGDLPPGAAERAKAVFRRLAEAEARVHGETPETVHFHEVGAVDAIVDIAGTATALALLGADRLVCSPLPMGSGWVEAAHGRLPVPAPAVLELVRGLPTAECPEGGERTTPTGAAILTTLAERFGPMPATTVQAVGYGAGSRRGEHLPNVLRVVVGEPAGADAAEADSLWLLETNLDDATPETLAAAAEAVRQAGARDVWMTPAVMKKGRAGVVLACLAEDGVLEAVEAALFAETPAFGLRRVRVERSVLAREHLWVETPYGQVRIKVGRRRGRLVTASPEYEDCLAAARDRGVAFREVFEAARAAWRAGEGGTR